MKKFVLHPELTNHCNFRCIFCPHSVYGKSSVGGNEFNREKGYMSEELFSLVLENASKYAKSVILGFFGEPLLHPRFEEYIKLIPANRCYDLEINTNWSLVTKENMNTLKLFDLVRISLDASYSTLWEELCPGGQVLDINGELHQDRFHIITEKIKYWLMLPDHSPTRIVYVVSSINHQDRDTFVSKWLPKLGASDHIVTKSVISYGGIMKDSYMRVNSCNIIKSQPYFIISWDGKCSPCNLDVNIELNAGNILKTRDISKIVEGDRWKHIMFEINQKSGICLNCFDANNWTENKIYYGGNNIGRNIKRITTFAKKHWFRDMVGCDLKSK